MKTLFIQITDPSEIDTTKVTVFDLNKRYIDRSGNMYSLRYNRELKKVEIIKIMRTNAKNESYFTQKMNEQRKVKTTGDHEVNQDQYAGGEGSYLDGDSEPFREDEVGEIDPTTFKEDLFTLMLTHKERINTIVKNIYNSKIVTRENRDASIRMDEIFRNIDIDCAQRIDKIINSYREMTEYPRSLNYYIGRLDNRARNMIGEIHSEEKKLTFVIHHEMHSQVKDLFAAFSKLLRELFQFLQSHKEDRLAKLAALEKQSLNDAMTSIESTIREIRLETEKLRQFEEYIYTISNFKK